MTNYTNDAIERLEKLRSNYIKQINEINVQISELDFLISAGKDYINKVPQIEKVK